MTDKINLEIPLPVLLRLLREHSLAASEFRCLDGPSKAACCWAVKACLFEAGRDSGPE